MNFENTFQKDSFQIILLLIASLLSALVFEWVIGASHFLRGFIATSILIFLSAVTLYSAWRLAGKRKSLGWMIFLAFAFRLVLTLLLAWGLPKFGYAEPPQEAGFVFKDAYLREMSAWQLARSDEPLTTAFSETYGADQYGGMLAMSALIYRYFSPDEFRPTLIAILSAAAMALSLPFLTVMIKKGFGKKAALWGGWLFALYPEGVLLGASQMREPFIILFFTILIWAVLKWLANKQSKSSIALSLISIIGLFLFSYRVAFPLVGILLAGVWVMVSLKVNQTWLKILIYLAPVVIIIGIVWFYGDWVSEVISWDTRLTMVASGVIQYELESIPSWLHFPFILFYGLFQPVLPATIAAPAPWIWRGLNIFRSVGWYALLPVLVYAFIRVWFLPPSQKKRWLTVMILFIWAWIFLTSARAGGDQWDNPRYRTILLPWMANIFGWVNSYIHETKDRWLHRVLLIEGIFLAFFTEWYISRYYPVIPRLEFWLMVVLIALLSASIITVGMLQDRRRQFEDDDLRL